MPSKIKSPKHDAPPPKTEVECKRLQEEYLKPDCPQSIKDEYFTLLRIYARSLALKEIKRKGIFLPPERVDEICTDATLLLMKQYSKPGWRVLSSFAGTLYWKLLEAMYGQASEDMVYSLNTTFSDDVNSKEILDIIGSNACLPWQKNPVVGLDTDDPWDHLSSELNVSFSEIKELIDDAYDMLPYRTFIKFLPWLVLQLRRPRARNTLRTFSEIFLEGKEEDAFDILFLEMRNKIIEHT